MTGINKRLVIPSILLASVSIGSAVLAYSAQETSPEPQAEVQEFLPEIPNRELQTAGTEPVQSVLADLGATATVPQGEPVEKQANEVPPVLTPKVSLDQKIAGIQSQTIQVTLKVHGPKGTQQFEITTQKDASVYEIMKLAQKKFDFSFKVSKHASLGLFVEEIEGTRNNPVSNVYWLYYLNGQFASRGISNQHVQGGDIILWSYE